MSAITVPFKGVDYNVRYEVERGVADASFKVWIGDMEMIEFEVRGYLIGSSVMPITMKLQEPLVDEVVTRIRSMERI